MMKLRFNTAWRRSQMKLLELCICAVVSVLLFLGLYGLTLIFPNSWFLYVVLFGVTISGSVLTFGYLILFVCKFVYQLVQKSNSL